MKRDMELCRSILLAIDGHERDDVHLKAVKEVTGEDAPAPQIALLIDAGFLAVSEPGDYFRLTWRGADLVEQIRNEAQWTNVLTALRAQEMPETLDVILPWLAAIRGVPRF
jgi:hypothetical protein